MTLFEHVLKSGKTRTKTLDFYYEIRDFAVGLGTVITSVPTVDENYSSPEEVDGPRDHMMRVALKMFFESRLIQRHMHSIIINKTEWE
jgi:hypothetical protein